MKNKLTNHWITELLYQWIKELMNWKIIKSMNWMIDRLQTFCAASSCAFSLTGTGPNLALSSTTSFSALSFSYTEYRLNPCLFFPFLLLLLLLLILLIPPVSSTFSFSSFYITSPPHLIRPSGYPSAWFSQSSSPPHPSSSSE